MFARAYKHKKMGKFKDVPVNVNSIDQWLYSGPFFFFSILIDYLHSTLEFNYFLLFWRGGFHAMLYVLPQFLFKMAIDYLQLMVTYTWGKIQGNLH